MRTTAAIPLAILAAAMLAACGHRADPAANTQAAAAFVPPPVQHATPIAGQAQTTPITAYVGHYPRDAVEGVDFFDRTAVATALTDAVGDAKVRRLILGRTGPQTPIFSRGTLIASWGCEEHNCGDHNWTFLIDPTSHRGQVCYHDSATMGTKSHWYDGGAPRPRDGGCPSEPGAAAPAGGGGGAAAPGA